MTANAMLPGEQCRPAAKRIAQVSSLHVLRHQYRPLAFLQLPEEICPRLARLAHVGAFNWSSSCCNGEGSNGERSAGVCSVGLGRHLPAAGALELHDVGVPARPQDADLLIEDLHAVLGALAFAADLDCDRLPVPDALVHRSKSSLALQ